METHVLADTIDIGHRDAISDPVPVHQLRIAGPYLAVVRAHEERGDAAAEGPIDPLAEVRGLRR